jgi:hypothetical protein
MERLPKSSYVVHNDMQELEHSLEAIILLHRKNKLNYPNWCLTLITKRLMVLVLLFLMWYQNFKERNLTYERCCSSYF